MMSFFQRVCFLRPLMRNAQMAMVRMPACTDMHMQHVSIRAILCACMHGQMCMHSGPTNSGASFCVFQS